MTDERQPKPVKILSTKNLLASWKSSKDSRGKGGAPGIDRVAPVVFSNSQAKHFQRIVEEAKSGSFRFQPLRAIPIAKENGKYRIICIPTVRDRLVQRVILNYLTAKRDLLGITSASSFGAAKGTNQGTHAAISEAIRRREKKPFILKTDISKFFDNIPREYLMKQIRSRLRLRSVVPLLEQIVNCEISEKDSSQRELIAKSGIIRGKGLRQGMPLSPILSNLVLKQFDSKLSKLGKSFIRYVDDLVVFEDNEEECQNTLFVIERELNKLELSIPNLGALNSKTQIIAPEHEVLFLGLSIYKQKNGAYAKRIPDIAFSDLEKRIDNDVSFEHFEISGSQKSKSFPEYNTWFVNMHRGYCAAYSGATNLASFEKHVLECTNKAKQELISQVFGSDVLGTLDEKKLRFLGLN